MAWREKQSLRINSEQGSRSASSRGPWMDGRVPLPRDRSRFYACRAFDGDLDIYRRRATAAAPKTKSRARGGEGEGGGG